MSRKKKQKPQSGRARPVKRRGGKSSDGPSLFPEGDLSMAVKNLDEAEIGSGGSGDGSGATSTIAPVSGNSSGGSSGRGGPVTPTPGGEDGAALHEIAQARYLNYALSVITSRALPDVRDGLK